LVLLLVISLVASLPGGQPASALDFLGDAGSEGDGIPEQGDDALPRTDDGPQPEPEVGPVVDYGSLRAAPNVITYNLCNPHVHCCHLEPDSFFCMTRGARHEAAQHVVAAVAFSPTPGTRPFAVATQEMCNDSWAYLAGALTSGDFNYNYNRWQANISSSSCEIYGNGIFWRGGCRTSASHCKLDVRFNTQSSSESEERGFACGRSENFSFEGCSAHLSNKKINGEPTVAYRQEDQYRSYVGSRKPYGVVYAMGDFNIGARNSELNDWRSKNHEGDGCQCHGTHVDTGKKIDYIWFTRGANRCTGRVADAYIHRILLEDGGSDHAIYRAYPNCSI